MLGLDPHAREFHVVYGSVAENDTQIVILSRPILQILVELSPFITLPADHVAEHRSSSPWWRREERKVRRS